MKDRVTELAAAMRSHGVSDAVVIPLGGGYFGVQWQYASVVSGLATLVDDSESNWGVILEWDGGETEWRDLGVTPWPALPDLIERTAAELYREYSDSIHPIEDSLVPTLPCDICGASALRRCSFRCTSDEATRYA
jgi:hypothetical protein